MSHSLSCLAGPLGQLRSLTALVHSTPGASLQLDCGGRRVEVGRDPGSDLSPCDLRRVLAAETATVAAMASPPSTGPSSSGLHPAGSAGVPGLVGRVTGWEVGGTLEPLGAGLYADRYCAEHARGNDTVRLTTFCGPLLTEKVLAGVATGVDGITAQLSPDTVLGVVSIALRGAGHHELVEAGAAAAASLVVEELLLANRT